MVKNREKKSIVSRKRKRRTTHDKDANSWHDLPNELLELIKKRLFYIEQCKFSSVCKSWNSIEEGETSIILPLQQMPWLLVIDETGPCTLVDSINGKKYSIDMNEIKKKMKIKDFHHIKIHESKQGWLLISICDRSAEFCVNKLFLYSPFYNHKNNFIQLPNIYTNIINLASFTSNPLDKDCKIVTLNTFSFSYRSAIFIRTYQLGESSWTKRIINCEFISQVTQWMYAEGMFYYITSRGKVGSYDLANEKWNVLPPSPLTEKDLSVGYVYMAKTNEELFLIIEESLRRRHERWCCSKHHICRFDLSTMAWEKLNSIGDRVLFIGSGYNCVLDSSVLKANGELKGIADMIYYCCHGMLTYCSVRDFIDRKSDAGSGRRSCARHYGDIATKRCNKLLIDPPPVSSSFSFNS